MNKAERILFTVEVVIFAALLWAFLFFCILRP